MRAPPLPIAGVTLACIDCVSVERAQLAIERSTAECRFDDVKLFTSLPNRLPYSIAIPPIETPHAYSQFIVHELHKFIDTSHVLIVQHDGWVCNGRAWSDEWREFDYIGGVAHWTEPGPDGMGGNGGFSLRSRRLLQAGQSFVHPVFGCHPEDGYFSATGYGKLGRRRKFEALGMRFAPRSVQDKFCREKTIWKGEFGHHKCNLRDWDRAAPDRLAPPRAPTPAALSVIIPTIGRSTLRQTLLSIEGQRASIDEVLVVGDGEQPNAREIVADFPFVRYFETAPSNCWGHAQRNAGITQARGDYLLFMDDDDIYTTDAFAVIRDAIQKNQEAILIFRFELHTGEIVWRTPRVMRGNVGSPSCVVPNDPSRLGRFGNRRGGDLDWCVSCLQHYPRSIVWIDRIICICRPHLKIIQH